jgi:cytochrome b6-f complex iron-sulfur subunit
MPYKDSPHSRRDFLILLSKGSLALSGFLGLGMLLRFLGYQSEPAAPTRFDLGLVVNFPTGSHILVPQAEAVVFHDAQGLTALSLVCPHLGCVVNMKDDGFTCPCHGSRYQLDGSLINGPSNRPLRSLRLEITSDQHLILFTD